MVRGDDASMAGSSPLAASPGWLALGTGTTAVVVGTWLGSGSTRLVLAGSVLAVNVADITGLFGTLPLDASQSANFALGGGGVKWKMHVIANAICITQIMKF